MVRLNDRLSGPFICEGLELKYGCQVSCRDELANVHSTQQGYEIRHLRCLMRELTGAARLFSAASGGSMDWGCLH